MADKSMESVAVYDAIAQRYAAIFDKDLSDIPYLDRFLSYVRKGGKILDLGCGTGRLTRHLADRGFEVVGVDFSEEMLKIARRNHRGIKFVYGDMRKIKFSKGSFDAVSVAYSLFHLEKKEVPAVLGKIGKVLKPGGILFLVFQEGEGELYIDEPLLPGKKLFLNLYSEGEIRRLLEESGFNILSLDRKRPEKVGELPYDKMIIIARKG